MGGKGGLTGKRIKGLWLNDDVIYTRLARLVVTATLI